MFDLLRKRAPESIEMKMDEKLSVIELLKRATKLLFGNINLAFFLLLCSLPLFCFLILFELSFQTTVSFTSQFLSKQLVFEKDLSENDLILQTTVSLTSQLVSQQHIFWEDLSENDLIPWLIHTSLLYFFSYAFLDLLTTTMIVASSSIVYTSEEEPMGLLSLVRRSVKICQNRVRGTLFMYLTEKFTKWSAGWNMSLVVSVLEDGEDGEGIYGSDALSLSALYRRGHERRDLWMMLSFLVFALATKMPCLYSKCSLSSSGNGVLYTGLYVCFFCVGNVLRWLACVVCYHDCKTRFFRKKTDVEQAKPPAS
ncbi:uncharacterized protein LOC18992579 [Eutrema salsugineum]|uniref:uncharacterized protein LOC18992579 n=1 Tax=Eutrema salsugineum TaxID=72664 RepID=UPI000CED4286|nr:uncharacterized protein LOC18992579 [Eutrema salsugineum]